MKSSNIDQLIEIMSQLRHPERGCPWDILQDHQSIAHCSIEEASELVAAISKNYQVYIKVFG